jgi:hypothetical protein
MDFITALNAVFKDNDRITRVQWADRQIFCAVEEGKLCIKGVDRDDLYHPWVVTEQDFFAHDWEIVTDA